MLARGDADQVFLREARNGAAMSMIDPRRSRSEGIEPSPDPGGTITQCGSSSKTPRSAAGNALEVSGSKSFAALSHSS
ncbi:MAG: hypothetical protein ACLGG5_02510 [Thermoleophilia bacterium]